jgi:dihydrodipicolinate synthase/N-acetylneuraminate lyase
MEKINLEGIIPAVVVPMLQDFSIDFPAFERYLEWHLSEPVGLAVNVVVRTIPVCRRALM